MQRQNHVSVTPDASVVRQVPFSDAVSVLAQDRPVMGIVSGQGGATGQRERVAELTLMAREQGRDVHIRRPITVHVIFSPGMCVWPGRR